MTYTLIVYNAQGQEVFRKVYERVSGSFMSDIYQDYVHLGGPGGWADFF